MSLKSVDDPMLQNLQQHQSQQPQDKAESEKELPQGKPFWVEPVSTSSTVWPLTPQLQDLWYFNNPEVDIATWLNGLPMIRYEN